MKLTRVLLVAFTFAFLASCTNDDNENVSNLASCTNDDNENVSKGNYDNGVFILNEGNGSGNSSVSFLGDDLTTFKQDAYGAENPGDFFGRYVQSIFFDGDKAYVIAGGSNVINVVNRYSFKLITKIETGFVNPRYGVVRNGKAYVTNANEYGGTSGIVTMEDILEELVGNIFDEYDDIENEYEKIDENTFKIAGSVPISELKKILNVEIPEGEYDTLSGFLTQELGRIPEDGEKPIIETKDVTYKIEDYEDKRILWVKACKNGNAEDNQDAK